jgi:ethanolamine ammonia-lyase small subunit
MSARPTTVVPIGAARPLASSARMPVLEPVISRRLRRPVADVTPARVFLGHVSGSYRTATLLKLIGDQALARRAVTEPLDLTSPSLAPVVEELGIYEIASAAPTMAMHLANPALGRRLSEDGRREVAGRSATAPKVQFVVGDGLSATAAHAQVPRLLPLLIDRSAGMGWSVGRPFAVRHCRVGVLGDVGEATGADVVALLIGERPGLLSTESLSVYVEWRPSPRTSDADRNVISNIHDRGLSPADAAERTLALIGQILRAGVSGVALQAAASMALAPDPTLGVPHGTAEWPGVTPTSREGTTPC